MEYTFTYESKAAASILELHEYPLLTVTIDAVMMYGHAYDTPFGPSPVGVSFEDHELEDLKAETGDCLLSAYRANMELFKEVTLEVDKQRDKICEQYWSER